MLKCLSVKSSSSSTSSAAAAAAAPKINSPPPPPPRRSQGGTSSEASPSAALTLEYSLAVQSESYNETWSRIHEVHDHLHRHRDHGEEGLDLDDENHHQQRQQLLLGQVLQPNRECVEEALRHAKPNALTGLVSDYFKQSENTTQVCLLLHRSVYGARELYAPLHKLLDVLLPNNNNNNNNNAHSDSREYSSLSLSQSQCGRALDVFVEFDRQRNPFPSPEDPHSPNFDHMRHCFSQLKDQLDRRLRSSRSRIRLLRRATLASALCLVGTAVGVAASAVAITVHALTAAALVVAGPPLCCPGSSSFCSCMTTATEKREVARMKQLDAAAMGCVLTNDLATIDRLVRRLHTAVEGDKLLVRLGLERGSATDKHPIQEVLKQLGKSDPNFVRLLNELEESICLYVNTVNKARSRLLQQHIYTLHSSR